MEVSKPARLFLLITLLFNGLSGLICGALFMIAPDGSLMGAGDGGLLAIVQNFPLSDLFFRDLFWTGLALFLIVGVPSTIAAIALLRKADPQYMFAFVAARLLVVFCFIEILFMPNLLVIFFLLIGIIQTVIAIRVVRQNKIQI